LTDGGRRPKNCLVLVPSTFNPLGGPETPIVGLREGHKGRRREGKPKAKGMKCGKEERKW